MIKRMLTKTILYSLMVTLCLCQNIAQSKLVENDKSSKADVGRENPFSKLSTKNRPSVPRVTGVSDIAGLEINRPELFLETITLKFLDAKNLQAVIEALSSEYGRISTDAKSNSLIICDTKENLEMILAEIRKADRTPQQIMIEVVILDVQLNDDTEIGINWDILTNQRYSVGYRQNFTTSRLGSTAENTATIGNATPLILPVSAAISASSAALFATSFI